MLKVCRALQQLSSNPCLPRRDLYLRTALQRPDPPLSADEVIACLRRRWKATYDIQLVVRRRRLYLQVMWAYLEQQSFPMNEPTYYKHLSEVLAVVNRLGLGSEVRSWLETTNSRPRLGKALSLQLQADEGLEEFLV